jgi:DNA-binding response OmpR family regulator
LVDRPILVVDGEADLVASYERLLRRHGYRVVSVGSRRAGLLAVEAEPLSLLIADARLPDGDGLDVVRAARGCPAPPPVLVATVLGSNASRQAALAAGATAFLAKPFSTHVFTGLVRQLVCAAPR